MGQDSSAGVGDRQPPFRQPISATYEQDLAAAALMSRSLDAPIGRLWRMASMVGAAIVLALLVGGTRPFLLYWILFVLLAPLATHHLGGRQQRTRTVQQLSGGTGRYTITASLDDDHLTLDLGWTASHYRWWAFSGYHRTRHHLVLSRGGLPTLLLPRPDLPEAFITGAVRRLEAAGVPERRPETSAVQLAIPVLSLIVVVMAAYLAISS